jgi:predicted DNA-binding transcriptional regulator AlpA
LTTKEEKVEDRLLRVKELAEYLPLKERTIRNMLALHGKKREDGSKYEFPIPIHRLSRANSKRGIPCFKLSDVQAWIKQVDGNIKVKCFPNPNAENPDHPISPEAERRGKMYTWAQCWIQGVLKTQKVDG